MPKQSKHKNSEKGKAKVLKSSQRAKPKVRLIKKSANRKMVDFSVFYEDYVPPKLVIRDKQVEQIKQTLDNFA
ncbi:MAG: hypothetical protein QXV17_12410, partial [Candidatus Micrarchaeaceae archaeon]